VLGQYFRIRFIDINILNRKCEFTGTSSTIAVTEKFFPSAEIVLPMASSLPKYFFAVDSVNTMEFSSVNNVFLSPEIILNENTSKKDVSA